MEPSRIATPRKHDRNLATCLTFPEVVLAKAINGGHPAPSIQVRNIAPILSRIGNQNADIEMADEVWAFFKNKARP